MCFLGDRASRNTSGRFEDILLELKEQAEDHPPLPRPRPHPHRFQSPPELDLNVFRLKKTCSLK